VVRQSERLGEGKTEGLGCGRAEWKAREGAALKAWCVIRRSGRLREGRTEGLGCGKAE
jgi:hypothetical protein